MLYILSVSEYIDWFGYIQLGGFLVSPVIGFVFEKSCLSSREEARLTKQKKHLQRLRQCILPSLITIMSCLLFCILSMIKDIRFQVGKKYSVMCRILLVIILFCYQILLIKCL